MPRTRRVITVQLLFAGGLLFPAAGRRGAKRSLSPPHKGSALPWDPFPSLTPHARESAMDVGTAGCRGGEWVRVGAAVGLGAQRPGGVPQPMGWSQTPSKVASNPIRSGLDPIACISTNPWGCRGCQARAGWTPKGFAILCHGGAGLQPPIPLDLGSPGRSGEPGGGDTAPSLGTGWDTEHLHHPRSRLCAKRGRLWVLTTACVPIPAPWGPSPAGAEGCLDLGGGAQRGGAEVLALTPP